MRERVTALGGTLTISCTHGTRVCVSLPRVMFEEHDAELLKSPPDAAPITDKRRWMSATATGGVIFC
jgi:hypothetical protein